MRNPNNQSLTAARFRRLRNALRGLALTGALLAFTASTAGARPPSPDPQPFGDPSSAPTILHVSAPSAFDWGDAGIGAGAGLAISLIAVGGALSIYRRRERPVNTINPIG